MRIKDSLGVFFLTLLSPVVLSQNTPEGWHCTPLDTVKVPLEECVSSISYDRAGSVWHIGTKRASILKPYTKFCVILLSAENVLTSKNFYVKAHFSNGQEELGPFGGFAFNMEDENNGNYLMMRLGSDHKFSVEMGQLTSGTRLAKAHTNEVDPAVHSGAAQLELLVRDGEETVWVEGVLKERISAAQPTFVESGHVGFAFHSTMNFPAIQVRYAEVCTPITCTSDDGEIRSGGDQWEDDDGKTCTCSGEGITCVCGDETLHCTAGGTKAWTDPDTCISKCIPEPAECSSTTDPHYKTFDRKGYEFHGQCTYKAASCGDFVVNLKNNAPHDSTYTRKVELEFEGQVFSIELGQAKVDGKNRNTPVDKKYTNGDRVEIHNNGNLEMFLYSKGRNPSVHIKTVNRGTWIQVYIILHGSCAGITEGLCGNWNGNPDDELLNGNIEDHAKHHEKYDEHCPAPEEPPHQCDLIDWTDGYVEAEKICAANFKAPPFTQCHNVVPIGTTEEGFLQNCMTDVCHFGLDPVANCGQLDVYAEACIAEGVDLSDWRHAVEHCPFDCPAPKVYQPAGNVPTPTCLDKNPNVTNTTRGCFCPNGLFQQGDDCVAAEDCKCNFEGVLHDTGKKIVKKAECKVCICQNAGEWECSPRECPELECKDNEVVVEIKTDCCDYCDDNWVVALNPDVTVKVGQQITLSCELISKDSVAKKNIVWLRDGREVNNGISDDRLQLTIEDATVNDGGEYQCTAKMKDGKEDAAIFKVTVMPLAICQHEDGNEWLEGEIYKPRDTAECSCDAQGEYHCTCVDDDEKCEDPAPVVWFNSNCVKTCVPEQGICASTAEAVYRTFDGTELNFRGECKYTIFGCGEVEIIAYLEKDAQEDGSTTKHLEIGFKHDVFKMEGDQVTVNDDTDNEDDKPPVRKSYSDGSTVNIQDVGNYILSITQDGKQPLVELSWDKASSYSLKVHGTCKGQSTGLCGKWNDDKDDDMTIPGGKLAASVEEFGTAWAVIDGEDCPEPEPVPDMCDEDLGLDKAEYENIVQSVLQFGVLGECSEVIDNTKTAEEAVQTICAHFGDPILACPFFHTFAEVCSNHGFNSAGWSFEITAVINCTHKCIGGSSHQLNGPKPAPSCMNPGPSLENRQEGCFCPSGQVMEGGKCIKIEDCQCEYAGERHKVGETFEKPEICETCKCVGAGEEECEETQCNTQCQQDEIEVSEEGKCCKQCRPKFVEAVNPRPEAKMNDPLELTCKITDENIDINEVRGDIKWIKLNRPEVNVEKLPDDYEIRDDQDRLVLLIKKVNELTAVNYKCVVTWNGMVSEAVFEVKRTLPHGDLIEPVQDTVEIVVGKNLVLEMNILDVITDWYWECNGERMGEWLVDKKRRKITLTIEDAKADMAGSCTCFVEGGGSQDRAEIKIEAPVVNVVIVKPVKKTVRCRVGRRCLIRCSVKKESAKKVSKKTVSFCRLDEDGNKQDCKKASTKRRDFFSKKLTKASEDDKGMYVCQHTEKGITTVSEPITVMVRGA